MEYNVDGIYQSRREEREVNEMAINFKKINKLIDINWRRVEEKCGRRGRIEFANYRNNISL